MKQVRGFVKMAHHDEMTASNRSVECPAWPSEGMDIKTLSEGCRLPGKIHVSSPMKLAPDT